MIKRFQFGPGRDQSKSIRILDRDGKEQYLATICFYGGPLPEYNISKSGIMVLCRACDKSEWKTQSGKKLSEL